MPKKIGRYQLGRTLGEGSFSKVKYAVDTEDPDRTAYAVKLIDRQKMKEQQMEEQLRCEIAILKLLKFDFVVQLREVLVSQKHIYMVLELVNGGELFDRIAPPRGSRFEEPVARRYFQQIILGLSYCHSKGVAHRDLKPENLLLDSKDNIKITDFGLSKMQEVGEDKMLSTTCGTPHYVAPEIISEKPYSGFVADVWSCGVILFVMLAAYLPFEDPQINGLFNKIERGEYRTPRHFSEEVKTTISKLLQVDPAQRLTLDGLLTEDPWTTVDIDTALVARVRGAGMDESEEQALKDAREGKANAFDEVGEQEAEPGSPRGKPASRLNGFELACHMMMGRLTPFASGNGKETTIRRSTRFMANGQPAAITESISDCFRKEGLALSKGKEGSFEVKGIGQTAKGPMIVVASVMPTVADGLCMVEFRRQRGDTFDFQRVYEKVLMGLGPEVVPALKTVRVGEPAA
eukprot:TRINITY_DN12038_c0_g1_i1.p1 TRINITY_DN12038_c0_g1~~TRINITY_DN12038_c0_g1_i1.p1  ORF type:complete len:491 (+),score=154.67 TRINITY_DN12038_c0_g1_i1:93-1475(+)